MLHREHKILDITLHDKSFLTGIKNGVFFYSHVYLEGHDRYFQDEMYQKIVSHLNNGKTFFSLENFSSGGILLQRITFLKENISYIRTGASPDYPLDSDFRHNYRTNDGFLLTDWKQENIREDNEDVRKLLKTYSRANLHERLVSKFEPTYLNNIFFYQRKLNVSELNDISLKTGYYSILDRWDNIKNIVPANNNILKYRSAIHNEELMFDEYYMKPEKGSVEAVLELYSTENYIYQMMYISYPIVLNMSRIFKKSLNEWSEWRPNQTVTDLYWYYNSFPYTRYNESPTQARQLYVDQNRSLVSIYGESNESNIIRDGDQLKNGKNRLYDQRYNSIYCVVPTSVADYVYGYKSKLDSRFWEVGGLEEKKRRLVTNPYPAFTISTDVKYTNHYVNNIYGPTYGEADSIPVRQKRNGRNLLGYTKHETETSLYGSEPANREKEYFRYINGITFFWSADKLHMELSVNRIMQDVSNII